mgnify:CR=1 FL=1
MWAPDSGRPMLATRILTLQLVLGLTVLVALGSLVVDSVRDAEHDRAVDHARGVTATLATSPWVLEAVLSPDPAAALGPAIEAARVQAGVDFVVVMSPDGVRYTHPDPTQIGGTFIGDITGAKEGRTTVEDAVGTLGPSVRVVSPILDEDGEIVALVSTGVVLRTVTSRVTETLLRLGVIAAIVAVIAVIGTVLIARSVRRATFGLGPQGLARLHSFQDAVLHSMRAGLVLLDCSGRVVLANDEARRMLDAPRLEVGTDAAAIEVGPDLVELFTSGRVTEGEVHTAGGRAIVVTQVQAIGESGTVLGTVATLRDRTDLARLSGELDNLKQFTASLRARAHEADNRLHTVAMLVELGQTSEALAFADSISAQSQALTDAVTDHVDDPTVAALLLGEAAKADERGIRFTMDPACSLPRVTVPSHELVTILGNLLDNAMDAAASGGRAPWVHLAGGAIADRLVLEVSDSGDGVPPALQAEIWTAGVTTKTTTEAGGRGVGLALARAAALRLRGSLDLLPQHVTTFRLSVPIPRDAAAALTKENP